MIRFYLFYGIILNTLQIAATVIQQREFILNPNFGASISKLSARIREEYRNLNYIIDSRKINDPVMEQLLVIMANQVGNCYGTEHCLGNI